jgi:hypothetical protein
MVYRYVWDNSHELTMHVNFIVKYVCYYMGLGSNDCFMTNITLTDGHYKMYIISRVTHLRSDLIRLLVLWMVAYNGQNTGIVLQVPWDNANPTENE